MTHFCRANEIDCHVPLFDSKDAVKSSFQKGHVPSYAHHQEQYLIGNDVEDGAVPTRLGYLGALTGNFQPLNCSKVHRKSM